MLARSRGQFVRVFALAAALWTCAGDPTAEGVGTPVVIQPDYEELSIAVGGTGLLSATVLDTRSNRLQAPVTFTTCNPAVATVTPDTAYHPVPPTSSRAIVTSVPPAAAGCVVVASSGLQPETVAVTTNKATPTVTAVPRPLTDTVGHRAMNDTASISGGFGSLAGTITFTLYDSTQASCTTGARYTQALPVTAAGAYGTSPGVVPDIKGTWHWLVVYSGNSNNKAVTVACAAGAVTVAP